MSQAYTNSKTIMKKIFITFFAYLFFCNYLLASEIETQSVIVWEVKSQSRTMYFVGEIHKIEKSVAGKVSNNLAERIFNLSSKVLTENLIPEKPPLPMIVKNSNRLDPKIWKNFEKSLFDAFDYISAGKPKDKQDSIYRGLLNDFDHNEIHGVIEGAGLFLAAKIIKKQRENIQAIDGFLGASLLDLEAKNTEKKVQPIETIEEKNLLRKTHCNGAEDIENAFLISIELLKIDPEKPHPVKQLTRWFLDLQKSENAMTAELPKFAEISFTEKCDLAPRNKLWYPTILKSLTDPGPAVSVFAGVGHFLGKEGLFNMLQKQGLDLKIRQVTLLDFNL